MKHLQYRSEDYIRNLNEGDYCLLEMCYHFFDILCYLSATEDLFSGAEMKLYFTKKMYDRLFPMLEKESQKLQNGLGSIMMEFAQHIRSEFKEALVSPEKSHRSLVKSLIQFREWIEECFEGRPSPKSAIA